MTAPPLPASPCLRIRLDYTQTDGFAGGNRIYVSYGGSSPTGANCIAIADAVEAAWLANIAQQTSSEWALTEVDVLDISSLTGLSGQWSGSEAGTVGNDAPPASVAYNVEFDIARRYRGGKPRIFWPPGASSFLADAGHWDSGTVTTVNTNTAAFFTAVEAIDVGAVGSLTHVNLSYYKGFTNVTNSSGRTRAAPTYRAAAQLDTITGYACKAEIGSQRRRRAATTQ